MKLHRRTLFAFTLLFGLFAAPAVTGLRAVAQAPATTQAQPSSSTGDLDAAETDKQTEAFRHSAPVKKLAAALHMDTEQVARIFEDINSGIVIVLVLWLVLKTVPKALRNRQSALEKQLVEARLATSQANERLAVVEERLSKLGIEIDAIREQTEREMAEDEKRIHASIEEERQRIVASAEQEIEAAGAAARRELKALAADLAIERALHGLRITESDDQALIHGFAENLKGERN
ncbi:ATPase [Silvibacterium sp.]|uniref:F0F1 ATP synthase subunit B family protein n=1 Tax=Silvibacterium sp. TaxID=1964179 RepID=UPI0039E29137